MLFLLTAGFFLTHRTAKIFNIAGPDFSTLGAYLIWSFFAVLGWNIWGATVAAIISVGLFVILLDRVSYRYLRGATLSLLLCSIGMSLVFRYGIFMAWGGRLKKLTFSLPNVEISGIVISGSLLLALTFVAIVFLLMYYLLNHTRLGATVRAVSDNPTLAESFGIDTERTLRFVWFITGAIAPLGGLILILYLPLTYHMGHDWILLVLAVSILSGEKLSFANLLGATVLVVAGMELSLFFVPQAYRTGIGFIILVLVIVIRRLIKK
jgi:branched-subunit amino acid ABC-type transport system permease component